MNPSLVRMMIGEPCLTQSRVHFKSKLVAVPAGFWTGQARSANGALDGHRLRVGIHLSTLTCEHRTEQRYANSRRKYSMEQSGALHKPPLACSFQSDSNLYHIYRRKQPSASPKYSHRSGTLNDESHT